MSASDLARSAGPTVAEILAKLGTEPEDRSEFCPSIIH